MSSKDKIESVKNLLNAAKAEHNKNVQARDDHYSQNWYDDMQRDGVRFDSQVYATLKMNDLIVEALKQLESVYVEE